MLKSVKFMLIMLIVILVISLSGIISLFSLLILYNSSINAMHEQAEHVGIAYVEAVEGKISAITDTLKAIAVDEYFLGTEITEDEINSTISNYCAKVGFSDLIVIRENGIAQNGVDLTGREYYQRAIKGETYISDPLVNSVLNTMMFFVSTPYENSTYGNKGVLVAAVKWTDFSDILSGVKLGDRGISAIINKDGLYMAHSSNGDLVYNGINDLTELNGDAASAEYLSALNNAINNTSGLTDEFKYENENQMIFYSTIDGTNNWTLIMRGYVSDFIQEFYSSRTIIIILLIVFVILGVIMALIIGNVIANPVIAVANRLKKLSEGDLNSNVPVSKSKNELGDLVNSLDKTVTDMKKYIGTVSNVLNYVADGDLTHTVDIECAGDFSPMKTSTNNIIHKLGDILHKISTSSEQVSSGSNQISEAAQMLAQGATEQAATIEELSSTISEINKQTTDNSNMAVETAKMAEAIKVNAEKGNNQMNEMMKAVEDINQASQSISNVIKVIDSIASQTNILALNAAVEAARAGTAGKGFAVVAEEVRNLAGKSAEAAKDTSRLIANSIEKTDLGARIANETAASLAEIVTGINQSTQMIAEIARSSEGQSASISQVNFGIEQVAKVVQQNSATSEEVAASSEELNSQAGILEEQINNFILNI